MKIPPAFALSAALLGALPAAPAPAAQPAQTSAAAGPAESADDARFRALYEKEWAWRQATTGEADEDSDSTGDNPQLPDVSPAAQQARLKVWDDVLAQLDGIDPATLSPANRVNYAVYRDQVENLAAAVRFRAYEMPFNSDTSFWSNLGFMAERTLRTPDEYRAYIARLADVPRYFGQHIANMRAGLKRGFTVPRAVLDGRDVSIAMVAEVKDPAASGFYAPFRQMPATIPAAEQQALREAAKTAIADAVVPAFGRLLAFFRDEYVPGARTTLAAEALPDGAAFYRRQILEYTTLDLTPAQIHAIGLEQVAKIQQQMNAVIDKTGFTGRSPQTRFADFLQFLRTDPRFYAKTPQELLDRAAWIAKRADGEVGKFIGTLPRGRFTIKPVPADIAPFWTAGRGGAGVYWVNTYDLPSRPLYNLPALTLHESSPGHSLQLNLAAEQGGQPAFRRDGYISAYGEGWALYTEYLGQEMGLYETPYDEFGYLTYQMWRACRLVIDTGVHHDGWTRQQAVDYLAGHTALSRHEVETEVDRYISWPGQALSYMLGELTIQRLRTEAEQALGPRFDIRAFHDAVLSQGSVPMPVLEQQVRAYIAAARSGQG
mgnify:CR=1 FL=1